MVLLQWYLFTTTFLVCAGYTLLRYEHIRIVITFPGQVTGMLQRGDTLPAPKTHICNRSFVDSRIHCMLRW